MNPPERAREQGVALLMTLGVLSLVLILAMSFSFTARSGRQLAQNNAEMVRVGFLARSGLDRVVAALGYRYDKAQTPGIERLYPATDPAGVFTKVDFTALTGHPLYGYRAFWAGTSSSPDTTQLEAALAAQLGMGTTALPASPVAKQGFIPEADAATSVSADASWHHVFAPEPWIDANSDNTVGAAEFLDVDGSSSWGDRLIARTCFLLIDESGKLDPASLLTINTEPVWDRSAPDTSFYDLNGSGLRDNVGTPGWVAGFREVSGSIPRRGLSPQEIILPLGGTTFWDDVPTVGATAVKSTWFDWPHIASHPAFGADAWTVVTTPVTTDPLRLYFPYSYDIEAYRYDPGTGEADYHRFDIWSVDWAGTTWDETALRALYTGTVSPFWTTTAGGAINPTASAAAPALEGFEDAATTLQVLANLVDMSDPGSVATCVPPGDPWNALAVGNEKQPYINEVAFVASYVKLDPDTTPNNGDESGTFVVDVLLEVAEIYGANKPFTGTVKLDFTLTDCSTNTVDIAITGAGSPNAYTAVQGQWTFSYSGAATPDSVVFQITKCRAVINDGGTLADAACMIEPTPLSVTIDGTSLAPQVWYGGSQVEDPRCNTLAADWTVSSFVEGDDSGITMGLTVSGTPPTVTATGEINEISGTQVSAVSPITNPAAADHDLETVADPVGGLSTAYIADRPDLTFWELGAIHRGKPWQTINLKAYSSANSGRTYAGGDAILLDQLKLGGFTHVQGRVNANSADPFVWGTVLDQVKVGWAYTDSTNPATISTAGTALSTRMNIASAIATLTSLKAAFDNRGQIADQASFPTLACLVDGTGGVAQDTDSKQEEIIGKIANLLTVRQNLFTVLVTAQTVVDTGANNPGTSRSVQYATGKYCTIQSEQKLLATVYRDAFNNTFRVVRLEYVED